MWWPVGINNYEENKLSFYPNPVNDIVTITLNNSESNTQITLSDLRGRILQTLNFKQTDKMTINMKNLSQGIYIIHVIAGEWSRKIKVTKE
ncbi:MAG: T9SS type A sorting domain-containing protein [Bacteroidetes bacterium]|nr:T9SS type A sorting domain-containing protein [Bacteroidota bacterium]